MRMLYRPSCVYSYNPWCCRVLVSVVIIRGDVCARFCVVTIHFSCQNHGRLSEWLNGLFGKWDIPAFQPFDVLSFPTDALKKYGGHSGECCSLFDSGYDPEQLWKLAPGACIYNQSHFGHVDPVYTAVSASCGVPTPYKSAASVVKWEPNVGALWLALFRRPCFKSRLGNRLSRLKYKYNWTWL
jgi:hypothetical protein